MPLDGTTATGSIAPLRNVALFAELVERVLGRSPELPGLATLHGPSGYGKSFASLYVCNKFRAYRVQVKSVWTRKKLCAAILEEMGIQAAGTIPDMVDQIGNELSLSRRPLIIDEADFLVSKGLIEIVRDIYESSQGAASIILVGEENLPSSLKRWERVHGRMLDWVAAQPASRADAKHLAQLYCKGTEIADDLLDDLFQKSAHSVRRICVNLDRVREQAATKGKRKMSRADFDGDFFTGNPPQRRVA